MFVAFSRHSFKGTGPHIDRLNMDGKGSRIHVVESGLGGPDVSLYYDEELHRIFWTDPRKEEISSAAIDGKSNGVKKIIYHCCSETLVHVHPLLFQTAEMSRAMV